MKSYLNSDSQTKLKLPVILLLGNNLFSKNNLEQTLIHDYEIVSLAHLPTIAQIESLAPDLVIINLEGKREIYAKEYLRLANEIKQKFQSNLPLICLTEKTTQKNLKANFTKTLFQKIWKAETPQKTIQEDLQELSNNLSTKKKLSTAIFEFEKYKKTIAKEFEEASVFQGALFNQAIASTNLKAAYHYYFAKEIGGNYFKIFNLSKSQVGLLIGEVNGEGAAAALLMGFIQGELASLSTSNSRLLWSPAAFLSQLSDSIFSYNQISGLSSSAWYGVVDLTNGHLNYARAGHPSPIHYSKNNTPSTNSIQGGSGFPLGLFENMQYKDFQQELNLDSTLLLYTSGLLKEPQANNQSQELRQEQTKEPNWLENTYTQICAEQKPLKDIPALIDRAYTDLIKDAHDSFDRTILACHIATGNQALVTIPNTEKEEESSDRKTGFNLLNNFTSQDFQLTKQLIQKSCSTNLSNESAYELELALNELFRIAKKQVRKGQEIAKLLEKTNFPSGFLVTWWIHETSLDISIRLDSGAIPWRYNLNALDPECEKLDAGTELNLFFEEIHVNTDGYELSMNKRF